MRVLHTADWHLREYQFGKAERSGDHFAAALSTIQAAREEKVDLIVHGGDMFNSSRLTSALFVQLLRLNQALNEAGLKMLAITGNHDMCEPPWYAIIAQEAEILGQPCAIIPMDWRRLETHGFLFLGIPSCSPERLVETLNENPDVDVCLWHGAVLEFIGFSSDQVIKMADIPFKGRAFLMGDIHIAKYMEHNGCLFGYPGSTEIQKKDEPLEKTATIIEITKEKAVVEKYVRIANRQVLTLDILSEEQMPDALSVLQGHTKTHTKTIALVNYSNTIENATQRLQAVVDPNYCILRAFPTGAGLIEVGKAIDTALLRGRPLWQFAELFFSRDTPLWGLAEGFLKDANIPGEEINNRIQHYVEQRLQQ